MKKWNTNGRAPMPWLVTNSCYQDRARFLKSLNTMASRYLSCRLQCQEMSKNSLLATASARLEFRQNWTILLTSTWKRLSQSRRKSLFRGGHNSCNSHLLPRNSQMPCNSPITMRRLMLFARQVSLPRNLTNHLFTKISWQKAKEILSSQ